MKIVHFFADNFKRLKVVEFNPDENIVVISGKNHQGKSSVLDSIWSALQYKASKGDNPSPVRNGQDKAEVTLDLGEYVVTRQFDSDGDSRLRIETKQGHIVKSPQALLDRVCGNLAFDPLSFANAKDPEKRRMLEDIFGLNLAEFDAKDASLKETRKDQKRELEMIEGRLVAIKPPEHTDPASEISASDLIKQLSSLIEASKRFDRVDQEVKELDKQIEVMQAKRASLIEESLNLHAQHKLENRVENVAKLQEEVVNIESRNARAREVQEYLRLRGKFDELKTSLDTSNKKIELNKIEKQEAIEAAKLPISGLEVRETGIFVNDVPFNQLSASEQIKISMLIAMAANPELRVIQIKDGSLLDEDTMKEITELVKDKDYQLWLEVVSNDDKIGVVIEDGALKKINV